MLRFVISRDGSVSSSRVSGLDHAPKLSACFARAIYGITFPEPEGGIVTVLYPWLLKPPPIERPAPRFGYR